MDANGLFSGTAIEKKPIASTYQDPQYFYTAPDGAMTFMAPTGGATTSGSHYPRSELRELTSSGANSAWTIEQGGSLSATVAVNELPVATSGRSGRVVIGQIHGPNDELCRLYYDNGQLYFHDDKSGASQTELEYVLKSSSGVASNIPLNAKFDYSIVVASGNIVVSARYNGVSYSAAEPISNFWVGQALYFKAGVYVQVGKPGSGAGTMGTGRGKVSFYKLAKPSHP
ncbi:MAG: polysaccharide lyase family 7 protein [Betaproteobacteria bacterium]